MGNNNLTNKKEEEQNAQSSIKTKIIGALLVLLGFFGWKTYLFAGTGCAFLICLGLVIAGIACMFSKK